MSSPPESQDVRVALSIQLKDVPKSVHSLHIDIGKDINISFDKPSASLSSPAEEHDKFNCWTCGRPGHFARQCLSDRWPLPNACYECGATDHYAVHCHIPLRSPLVPMAGSYVCMAHNKCRGKLNVFQVESGG